MKLSLPTIDLRGYQIPSFEALLTGAKRRGFKCWHRRAGKDIADWNLVVCMAAKRPGMYLYTLPTYAQARKAIWDAIDSQGRRFLDFIPRGLVKSTVGNEMKVTLKSGSIIQVVGTDEIDRLMGTNPIGVVFSEFSLQKPTAWQYISPILRENGGWAVFNGTMRPPSEAPHFCELLDIALEDPEWFAEILTIEDTGVISAEEVQREVDLGIISPQLARQEYYNDRFASSENILIKQELLQDALKRGMPYPYEPTVAGIDVGHSLGGDPSAVVIRRGGKIIHIAEERLDRLEKVAGWAAQKMIMHDCKHATCDGIGWGAGLSSLMMREFPGLDVREVNVAESPSFKDLYSRRRDELWHKCAKAFEGSGMDIPESEMGKKLVNELSGVTYEFLDVSNKMKVMSKRKMKEQGKKSPNLADALVLTFDWGNVLNANAYDLYDRQKRSFIAA